MEGTDLPQCGGARSGKEAGSVMVPMHQRYCARVGSLPRTQPTHATLVKQIKRVSFLGCGSLAI
ncbi:MAG: hypothetical protein AAGB11_01355 [Pseudomonadota bacterium]